MCSGGEWFDSVATSRDFSECACTASGAHAIGHDQDWIERADSGVLTARIDDALAPGTAMDNPRPFVGGSCAVEHSLE
jgi:hypothetical protein